MITTIWYLQSLPTCDVIGKFSGNRTTRVEIF